MGRERGETKLSPYPSGHTEAKGEKHVALYLEIEETKDLSPGWHVDASIKMFRFDHSKDKYLTVEVTERFSIAHASWGESAFFPLKDLNNLSKGFLVNNMVTLEAAFLHISVVKDLSTRGLLLTP
ncbi:hypothetical protein RJ639_043973 [Escallonia herrerae]|uniref:MATH domain-containing protein n=1 Tax=Escallonia herrerae TaxID=1293975 RepID=A0AA88WBX3_9ASTE|nr:hypothetical protein RJ639_043973 [Escallonia herrerae]